MANTIILKRSSVAGKVPRTTDLALGEVGINTHDGKMFIKKDDGTESVVEISASSDASALATDTTNFNGNLSSSDTTVQLALDTLDDLSISSDASALATDTTNFNGNLSSSDTTVQLALETLDDLSLSINISRSKLLFYGSF